MSPISLIFHVTCWGMYDWWSTSLSLISVILKTQWWDPSFMCNQGIYSSIMSYYHMNDWLNKLTETGSKSSSNKIRPQWQAHVSHSRSNLQLLFPPSLLFNCKWKIGLHYRTTCLMHGSSKRWPSIITKRFIGWCTNSEIYGHLRRSHKCIEYKWRFTVWH